MCLLNEQQIAIVINDVENEGINFSHLNIDLIDHVCCDIESQISQGISFNEAYGQVKEKFGIKGLRQIQQDTLMLIDKNYRIMKKSMKMIGVLAMALMAFGALFKIFHWPGGSHMLTVSFFFTNLVFFPALLYVMYKEVNQKKQGLLFLTAFIGGAAFMTGVLFKIMHWPGAHMLIFIGMCLITYLLIPYVLFSKLKNSEIKPGILLLGFVPLIIFISGLLFKIQHWPGANVLLTFGSIFLILVFVPLYYVVEIKKSKTIRIDFIFTIIALTFFIVLSFLLNINIHDRNISDGVFQHKSFQHTSEFIKLENLNLLNSLEDSKFTNLTTATAKLYGEIEELKITIVQDNYKTDRSTATKSLQSDRPLEANFDRTDFLLPEKNYNSPLPQLKANIEEYLETYNNYADSMENSMNLAQTFSITDEQWIHANFKQVNAAGVLSKLSFWQYQIQLAQHTLLTACINNSKNQ